MHIQEHSLIWFKNQQILLLRSRYQHAIPHASSPGGTVSDLDVLIFSIFSKTFCIQRKQSFHIRHFVSTDVFPSLQSIPEAQNDMIFSIICEELGLFGAVLLTILFVFLLYRLMFIAQNAPDLLGSLIVTGIFAHIALQVILNIAVVLNVIPTTGVTLPFISYGGTSILFLMTEMGIALNVSRQIRIKDN